MTGQESPHLLLGRLRFLLECIACFRGGQPLPVALCYVPREVQYKICKDSSSNPSSAGRGTLFTVFRKPSDDKQSQKKLSRGSIEVKKGSCITATGEEYCNSYGLWVKLNKEQLVECASGCDLEEGWILLCRHAVGGHSLVPVECPDRTHRQQLLFGVDYNPVSWEQVVDLTYSLRLGEKPKPVLMDDDAVQKLRFVPPSWSYECDEDLVNFYIDYIVMEDKKLGSIKEYVKSLDVSTFLNLDSQQHLTDDNISTFWQTHSESSQDQHWIRLTMKKRTIIKKLTLTIDGTDDCYLPSRVMVYGGEREYLNKLSDIPIDQDLNGDVCVLEDMAVHLSVIEIRILEARADCHGIRIWGLKLECHQQRDSGLRSDMFQSKDLIRYPRLEGADPDVLYRRTMLLQRFAKIQDSFLHHLVPAWDHSVGTFSQLKFIKPFLLLSKRRGGLINQWLKDSESSQPNNIPELKINRRLAMEHRDNPLLDPNCKNSIFSQVYEGLKTSYKYKKKLDYRWPEVYDRWWQCDFIEEGIDDGGGGFRDSLADISEELCPSSADCPVPLPFFVRTSNQGNSTGEARDMYVLNPSCRDFAKYEWIGQQMGAALRGKEYLVLALPGIVWKQLSGEMVSWSKDFPAVDSLLVKLLEMMEVMDHETFDFNFCGELTYTTVLSNQQVVELIPNGASTAIRYEDRKEFIRLVQKARMEESREQIAALRAGLLNVVPQAVLDLMTWQELEKKVCGDPEITLEALKRSAQFENMKPTDTRVQHFWEALSNFTNEDRSHFLRFVTGRSRLPAPIYIFEDSSGTEVTDALPRASTCSSGLYLPNYSSAKVCEERLRCAAYNCVVFDTDGSPWDR